MSNLYVRVHTSFYTNRKTLRLRAAIGNDAYWVPPRIWSYAAENQPDGIFSDYSAEEIAALINYTGDATKMLEALLQARFMDADPLRVHDWDEHNGYHKTYSERAKKAANARWSKPSPSIPPSIDMDIEKKGEASIATSNASSIPPVLKLTERISLERELKAIGIEIKQLGQLTDYDQGSPRHTRLIALLKRQTELRNLLGVVA